MRTPLNQSLLDVRQRILALPYDELRNLIARTPEYLLEEMLDTPQINTNAERMAGEFHSLVEGRIGVPIITSRDGLEFNATTRLILDGLEDHGSNLICVVCEQEEKTALLLVDFNRFARRGFMVGNTTFHAQHYWLDGLPEHLLKYEISDNQGFNAAEFGGVEGMVETMRERPDLVMDYLDAVRLIHGLPPYSGVPRFAVLTAKFIVVDAENGLMDIFDLTEIPHSCFGIPLIEAFFGEPIMRKDVCVGQRVFNLLDIMFDPNSPLSVREIELVSKDGITVSGNGVAVSVDNLFPA